MKNISGKFAKKIKTHCIFLKKRFPEKRILYEILGKNTVQPHRPMLTI
jgi:hypothetical protein